MARQPELWKEGLNWFFRAGRQHTSVARGAVPAGVKGTEREGEAGIIRFEFPNAPNRNDSKLEEIYGWEKLDEVLQTIGARGRTVIRAMFAKCSTLAIKNRRGVKRSPTSRQTSSELCAPTR